ncbi:MAG TPA: mandelate racemase/muconate lactonizing enzyme family protein [Beijerinckiaceae bacterium]|nr:mandelate racemase/muconate lactonizing enzyme family protein [Beijerinckiaceae bacterium]
MMLDRPVRSVEALAFRYPVATPVRTSFGIMHDRPAVFVRIEDADGAVGWGEVWCNFPTVGAEHRARLVNELLAPLVVGQTFATPRDAFDVMTAKTAVLALQSGEVGPLAQGIAGIDIALWDLAARRGAKPLWRLLGGDERRVPVYASGINPDAPERTVRTMRERGHRAFKLKIGFGAALDMRNLDAVRQEAGPGVFVAADANQAWSLDETLSVVERLAPFDLRWLEEPLHADRPWSEWRALREASPVPLAAGENIAGFAAFAEALQQDVLSVVQPDVAKWGGVSGCLAVGQDIVRSGATYCPHYLGGGIGLLASAHLLAAVGGPGMLEVDVNENPLRDALCGPVADVRDGAIVLHDGPGLGIDPDLAPLRRFKVDEQRVSRRAKSGWRRVLRGLGLKRLAKSAKARGVSVVPKRERYEPAKHYMRGPGPKARAAGTGADGGRTESGRD